MHSSAMLGSARMKRVTGTAYARAGLLGNPSDAYEGKAIALCLTDFSATVTLEAADRCQILDEPGDPRMFDSLSEMTDVRQRHRPFLLLGPL